MSGIKKSEKIGEANSMLNLSTGTTQVTKTGNLGFLGTPSTAHLFTFGPRCQGNALRGS